MESRMLTSGASGRVNALLSLRALKSLVLLIKAFIFFLLLFPFQLLASSKQSADDNSSSSSSSSSPSSSSSSSSSNDMNDNKKHHRKSFFFYLFGRKLSPPSTMPPSSPLKNAIKPTLDAPSRRALAIKSLLDDEDRTTIRHFSLFQTSRGDTLFTQSWTPSSTINIRGVVVLLHGLNEHSGRYNDFAKKLNANGYKVYGMDWIGHGGSDGLHAYVHSLDYAVSDMKAFLEKTVAENTGLPCFCFGHSTGAAIILKTILDPRIKSLVNGAVLSSPAVRVQPSHPIFGVLAPIVSFLFPTYQFSAANKNGTCVSRDPEALLAKYSDPLVYTGSIRVRTGYEILRISAYLQQNLNKLTTPFLVLHGTADAVTDPDASLELYEKAPSTGKSIKLYEGLLHDLLFEPEREVVAKDIIEWLNSRV